MTGAQAEEDTRPCWLPRHASSQPCVEVEVATVDRVPN